MALRPIGASEKRRLQKPRRFAAKAKKEKEGAANAAPLKREKNQSKKGT